jgi:iron-sulfur cluster repair protein YtfE (RIC family)
MLTAMETKSQDTVQPEQSVRELARCYRVVWDSLMHHHLELEDDTFFPWIIKQVGEEAAAAVERLATQHEQLHQAEARLEDAVTAIEQAPSGELPAPPREEFAHAVAHMRRLYTSHFLEEERLLMPLIKRIKKSEQNKMNARIEKLGKGAPKGDVVFCLMREVAVVHPEYQRVWRHAVPWFVRKVVLPGLARASDFHLCIRLLALPTAAPAAP